MNNKNILTQLREIFQSVIERTEYLKLTLQVFENNTFFKRTENRNIFFSVHKLLPSYWSDFNASKKS